MSQEILQRSFGRRLAGVDYTDRVGTYAVIFDGEGRIAVVQTSTGYFLPGGGIERNETHAECIRRECLEETGLAVEADAFVCKTDKYLWSDTLNYYMHGISYFYLCKIAGSVEAPVEADHELLWLTPEECVERLFPEHQFWAVEQAIIIASGGLRA